MGEREPPPSRRSDNARTEPNRYAGVMRVAIGRPLFVYRNGFEYLRYGYAAAATLAMFLVTGLILYLQWRIVQRWRSQFAI